MRGHVVAKCKEDKFEGVSATDFRFVEQILDISWPFKY